MTFRIPLMAAAFAVMTAGGAFASDNLKLMVPANPGGGWDQTGRALAQAMQSAGVAKSVRVENRGGASSIILANYLYSIAKPDALTVGVVSRALYFDQLVGRKEVQFDVKKFTWIGTPEKVGRVAHIRHRFFDGRHTFAG